MTIQIKSIDATARETALSRFHKALAEADEAVTEAEERERRMAQDTDASDDAVRAKYGVDSGRH
jgi:hypothetical protein